MKIRLKLNPHLTTPQEEVNSMVAEATIRYINAIRGIEDLLGVNIEGNEAQVSNHYGKDYAVYFENLGSHKNVPS